MLDGLVAKIASVLGANGVDPTEENSVIAFEDGFVTLIFNETTKELDVDIQVNGRVFTTSQKILENYTERMLNDGKKITH